MATRATPAWGGGVKGGGLGHALFGGQSAESAGTAWLAPPGVLLATRAASTALVAGSAAYGAARGRFALHLLTNWAVVLLVASLLLLTCATLLLLVGCAHAARALAPVAVPLQFVGATMALFAAPAYALGAARAPRDPARLAAHALHVLPPAIDVALGARCRFRLTHCLFVAVFFLAYVVFAWIRAAEMRGSPAHFWPYGFLESERQSAGDIVACYAGFFLWCAICALLVFVVARGYGIFAEKCARAREEGRGSSGDSVDAAVP